MGNRPAATETTPPPSVADQPGQGVRTLLQGPASAAPATTQAPPPSKTDAPPPQKPILPAWYLLGADLLLTSIGVVLFIKTITTSGWGGRLFYMGLVFLGGALGVAGAWVANAKNREP